MKRFKKLLVVCQEDAQPELAIERARILAKQNGAHVTLVDVINVREGELASIGSEPSGSVGHNLKNRIAAYHRARLAKFGARLREDGIETTETILWGITFVEIIRTVLSGGHDLVVKAINPVRFNDRQILGGLDMHLMRKCPCSVWILKDGFCREDMRILAAVDPKVSDGGQEDLNRKIMDLSMSLCPAEGHLHVAHAWMLGEEHALSSSLNAQLSAAEIQQLRAGVQTLRSEALEKLLSNYPEKDPHRVVHLVYGEAGNVVTQIVADNQIDLVVMGTVDRTDVPGLFMGNTAETILNGASCSVLGVKPTNFQTPVEVGTPSSSDEMAEDGDGGLGQVA